MDLFQSYDGCRIDVNNFKNILNIEWKSRLVSENTSK